MKKVKINSLPTGANESDWFLTPVGGDYKDETGEVCRNYAYVDCNGNRPAVEEKPETKSEKK